MTEQRNQTREESGKPPQYALRVIGPGRCAWQWEGRCYTSAGVLVPEDVIREDDLLIADNLPIPSDDKVLGDDDTGIMVVTLPIQALPPGAELNPLPGSKPLNVPQKVVVDESAKDREIDELRRRLKEAEDTNEALIADAGKSNEPPAPPPSNPLDAIVGAQGTKPGQAKK